MAKKKFEFASDGHFFASSFQTWRVNKDPELLIKDMKKEKKNFTIWYLPIDYDSDYEISFYEPQVETRVFLGRYNLEETPKQKG